MTVVALLSYRTMTVMNKTYPTVSFTVDFKEMDTNICTALFCLFVFIEQTPTYGKGLMMLLPEAPHGGSRCFCVAGV